MRRSDIFSGCQCWSPSRSGSSSRGAKYRYSLALAAALSSSSCQAIGDAFCDVDGCELHAEEWARIASLANLPPPPADGSNRYADDPAAAALGHRFYFETKFSGKATLVDTLGHPRPYARAPKGDPIDVSCATCHDPGVGGTDHSSTPNNVSIGAGWYDVNSQPTKNAAYYDLLYWNMRTDSLWAQILAVTESGVSMNGNRVHVAHVVADDYRSDYEAIFSDYPLPFAETAAALAARLRADGECQLVGDPPRCPTEDACAEETATDGTKTCWPRFPLAGLPGKVAGCQRGSTTEPFGDAYDCMTEADQIAVTRVYVNYAKAIAAYERLLLSRNSAFDAFVAEGPRSHRISAAAIRGAKVFVGKASCIDCHGTPLFSDDHFHNVGVGQVGEAVPSVADCPAGASCDCVNAKGCLPFGVYNGLQALAKNKFRRDSVYSDDRTDASRARYYDYALTDDLKGTWRTPSLRDVALTAPYMHDGAFATLEEVVHHYNTAVVGPGAIRSSVAVQFRPLELTDAEERDLVEFLGTLTGEPLPAELVSKP